VKVLAQRVYYSGITDLNIAGLAGGLNYNIQGTAPGVFTTINTTGLPGAGVSGATINVGALAVGNPIELDYIQGPLYILAGKMDTITFNDTGSGANKTGDLTSTLLEGMNMGADVTYAGPIIFQGLIYMSNPGTVIVLLGSGQDVFNVEGTNARTKTSVVTGANQDTVNVGSLGEGPGGDLDDILGPLTVTKPADVVGTLTLNVDDSGDPIGETGVLTEQELTGLGMPAGVSITYVNVDTLNISLGNGGNTFTVNTFNLLYFGLYNTLINLQGGDGNDVFQVESTMTETNITTGALGRSVINVGQSTDSGPVVDYIFGVLTVNGNGNDIMNVEDYGSTTDKDGTLTYSTLTGLRSGNVTPVTFDIEFSTNLLDWSLYAQVVTTDPVVIWKDPSVIGMMGFYQVMQVTASGLVPIPVGPLISITSDYHVQLEWINFVDYMPGITINYFGLQQINIFLGSGNNVFNILSTDPDTVTTVVNGTGNNQVNVQATSGETNIIFVAGTNIVDVGSEAPESDGVIIDIQGALNITGNSSDTLNVDDSGNTTTPRTGTLTSDSLTGLGMGHDGITFTSGMNVQIDAPIDMINMGPGSAIRSGAGQTSGTSTGAAATPISQNYYAALFNHTAASLMATDSPASPGDPGFGFDLTGAYDPSPGAALFKIETDQTQGW